MVSGIRLVKERMIVPGYVGIYWDYIAHFSNFHFKTFINLESVAATDLNINSFIILAKNSELRPFPVWVGQACTSVWQFTAWDGRLALASNVGSVKWKAQTAYEPCGKPGIPMALEWWQLEK